MVAVPNYTVAGQSPGVGNQGDLWFDTTTGRLNINTGAGFLPITTPAVTAAMTNSVNIGTNANGGPLLVPAVTGTLGGTWTIPPGYVGLAVDITNSRIGIIGSGGASFKTVAIA